MPEKHNYKLLGKRAGITRLVTQRELLADDRYAICDALSIIYAHGVVEHDTQQWTWDPNELVCYLFPGGFCCRLDIPHLMNQVHEGCYSIHEFIKFIMQLGLSLDEFLNLFSGRQANWFIEITDARPDELILNYIARVYHDVAVHV